MAKKLIDILRAKEQFSDRGEPTTKYRGLGTNEVTSAVDSSLESNNFTSRRRAPTQSGSDDSAQSVINALRIAAQRDYSLNEILDEISNMDDLLFREISKPHMGTAFNQGFQHNRYGPVGIGSTKSSNPVTVDGERLQFYTDGGVERISMTRKADDFLKDQTINPPGGASANQFREGILSSNSNDGVNEVMDFYSQGEETRTSIGTQHENDFIQQRRALEEGANLSKAMDTPQKDSFLESAIKNNRFKPTGFNGLTPETYLGNTEYSATGQVPKPYSAEDLPFEDAELLSSNQDNRKYHVLPRSQNGNLGGMARVGKARIKQINEDSQLVVKIGSQRTIEEIRYSLSQGDELKKSIFQNGSEFGDKIATSVDEIQNLRYFNLEPDIHPEYFQQLEQETGQFINNGTPGLRELSLSHLVYEMSKFQKGGPIPREKELGKFEEFRNRNAGTAILAGAADGLRQLGNRAAQEIRGELERLTGRSKEIARALLAPRGSSAREVLKTTEFTSNAFGANDKAKGEQSQNSTDAIRARLADTDNAMRRLFASSKDDEPFESLKDRYKEGFVVAGNFDRSFKEYENDFIGLAEDVQTLRDFFLKEGVERFYLSRNQTLISPLNNAKGRGMELFGVPQSKINKQMLANSPNAVGNILGADGERLLNRAVETAGPIVRAARRDVGNQNGGLILGRGPNPNIVGDSNALKFMHRPFVSDKASGKLFQSYIRNDEDGNPNMLSVLSQQLGRPENMGVRLLPGTTLINADVYEQTVASASDINLDNSPQDPDSDSLRRTGRKTLGASVGKAARGVQNSLEGIAGKISSAQSLTNNKLLEKIQNGNYDTYNEPTQLEAVGDSLRVNSKTVKLIEESLEAQYVPFYFQDLRTNEILSFHAFLQDLRDSFNPEYKTSKFIGRVDPVIMYSGHTDRQINVTFLTYATNPEDFGYLYEKVNRFIGFVYPQFNDGEEYRAEIGTGNDLKFRFASGKTGKAYIPFSQKQKAGPLVRMRVGDIIKSRAYDDSVGTTNRLSSRSEDFLGIKDVWTIVNEEGQDEVALQRDALVQPSIESKIADLNSEIRKALSEQGITQINGVDLSDQDFIDQNGELSLPKGFANGEITSIGAEGEIYSASNDNSLQTEFLLQLSKFDSIVNGTIADSQQNFAQDVLKLNEFISTLNAINRGNAAIRQSFEKVGGRGLAGAVSNLQIALLDEFPWETQPGLRAPMGFKISFSFQALHDVAPGLDAKGEMRPVYAPKIQDGPVFISQNAIAPVFDQAAAYNITGNSDIASRAASPPEIPRGPRRSRTASERPSGIFGNVVAREYDGLVDVTNATNVGRDRFEVEVEGYYLEFGTEPTFITFDNGELQGQGATVKRWSPTSPVNDAGYYETIRCVLDVATNSVLATGAEIGAPVTIGIMPTLGPTSPFNVGDSNYGGAGNSEGERFNGGLGPRYGLGGY